MSGAIVQPSPSLSVRSIAAFADELIAALSDDPSVTLDLSDVTHPDLTLLQLVEAARRQAKEMGGELSLAAPAAGPLAAVLERAGFAAGFTAADRQFWYHGVSA